MWDTIWIAALAVLTTRMMWRVVLHAFYGKRDKGKPSCTMAGIFIPEGTPKSIEAHERIHLYTGTGFIWPIICCYGWIPWAAVGHDLMWTSLLWGATTITSRVFLETVADIGAIVWVGPVRFFVDVYRTEVKIIESGFEKTGETPGSGVLMASMIVCFSINAILYPPWRPIITWLAFRKIRQDLS